MLRVYDPVTLKSFDGLKSLVVNNVISVNRRLGTDLRLSSSIIKSPSDLKEQREEEDSSLGKLMQRI